MKSAGDYASIVAQNSIAGFELGASVDIALLSGGLAASGSGALGSAGFDALTFGGESQEWGEFGKNQAVNAAWGAVGGPIASKFAKGAAPLLTSQLGNKAGAVASELTGAVGSASLVDLSQQSYGVLKYHATDGASGQREIDYSRTGVAALTSVATLGTQKSITKITAENKSGLSTLAKDQRMNQARMMAENDFSTPIVRNVIPRREVTRNGARGRASEARVLKDLGLNKNNQKVRTSEGNSIPDALTSRKSVEVKDCISVSCTRQIRIQTGAAKASGRESVLVTGTKTHVTKPAERAFDRIIRRDDLGPK